MPKIAIMGMEECPYLRRSAAMLGKENRKKYR